MRFAVERGLAWVGLMVLLGCLALAGCQSLDPRDAPRVSVVGVEPLPGEGLELRFNVKLRVQNPSDSTIEFDGVSVDLEVNGKGLASGVTDQSGKVLRFGETLITVPVSVSAFAAVRQALSLAQAADQGELPYVVTGKLSAGLFGSVRFSHSGSLKLAP